MSTQENLLRLIDPLDDRWLDEVLDYVQWIQEVADTLTPVEWERVQRGEQELVQGDRVSLSEWRRQHGI
ncbi:MAG: hypothetical protein OWU33_08625 [Firmicutes bacterium]|nr:hypothetical protein [Bacillota bacterium]